MNWVRKVLAGFLTLVLFVALLGTAFSTSSSIAFSHPDKIEAWLNQSDFYGHFVSNAIDQAKKSANSTENQGPVTLSDTAVQQAAQSAFPTQLLQNSVKIFLDANYAWLEGKTAQPSFTIDLTQAKQSFATQVGQYVQDHINSLPVCSAQQLAALGNVNSVDPLNITCRPLQLSAPAEAQLVTQRIQNSDGFLSNPVISANNISPNGGSSGQPYYQKYSELPKLYRLGVMLPWVYAVVALVCTLGIIFLVPRKRWGLRRIGSTLAIAGAILVASKFVADAGLKQAEKHIFSNASVGQLQQALTDFLQRAEHQLVKTDLLFGLGYLLLALIVLVVLLSTRNRVKKPSSKSSQAPLPATDQPQSTPPATDLPPRQKPTGPPLPPPKRPRLIQ
ncbi:MAG TPA: hypothetical protein VH234_00020 [Candidatus Saccharimonadales bacterium]|jgi:hypothetical protein|nr:hypothetical protein [Candidatus Saccharimonadales bacterium]